MKMIVLFLGVLLLLISVLDVPARGQGRDRKRGWSKKQLPDHVLKRFDKDRDGKLSDGERKEMRKAWLNRAKKNATSITQDILTPHYYTSGKSNAFKSKVDRFLELARKEKFHHPLQDKSGSIPEYTVPFMGKFGVEKGPQGQGQYHAAVDFHLDEATANVMVYAAHDGIVHTVRDAPKYRHYVSIKKDVTDDSGELVGKLVTIYAHVDLDLDEADSLRLNGKHVKKGDLIARHLYAKTMGGPHLHFEVRYYRPSDKGDETFYGFIGKNELKLSKPSAGPFSLGYWNPEVGYGFGFPAHHGMPPQ